MQYRDDEVTQMARAIFDEHGIGGAAHIADEIASAAVEGDMESLVRWLGVSKRFNEMLKP